VLVAFDTETGLIRPGCTAPPLVCLTAAARALEGDVFGELYAVARAPGFLREVLERRERLVGHNVAYDLAVCCAEAPDLWPLVCEALDAGRVHDTQIAEQLLDIAQGRFRFATEVDDATGESTTRPVEYTLAALAQRRCNRVLDKSADSYRLRYLELLAVDPAQWPPEARAYALEDAEATLLVREDQEREARALGLWDEALCGVTDEAAQVRAAFALHLTGTRGIAVDLAAVDALETKLRAQRAEGRSAMVATGLVRANGTRDMAAIKARVTSAYRDGRKLLETETGAVSTSAAVLRESGDPVLVALAEAGKIEKLLSAFVPGLRTGAVAPLTCRYNVLVESGRTSAAGVKVGTWKGLNVQQLPRAPGVRECFAARPGFVLCSVDYAALELRTLAQVCLEMLGHSALAEAFAAGRDPHAELAAEILGTTYEAFAERLAAGDPAAKLARQQAKPANFGFPGGLGAKRFCDYARDQYGVRMTLHEAEQLRARWRQRWPEVPEFQARVSAQLDPLTGVCSVRQLRSGRVRAGVGYTEACNTFFQGLAADGAKAALWRVIRDGVQHGVYPVAFLHDEILAEVRSERAHEGAAWLAQVMCEVMAEHCPGVPIEAEPALAQRWFKSMAPVWREGRLVPWAPKPQEVAA